MPSSRSSRRSSASSLSSVVAATTPLLPNHDEESTAGLVLVPEDELESASRDDFELSSDDEIVDDISARLERLKASSIPPLEPARVFLYLLIPYLHLGPFLLSTSSLPLKFSLPAIFAFALCALVSRRLSYMITKYVHKADLEDIVLDVLARGPSREGARATLRTLVRSITTTFRVLLAAVYLSAASTVLLPLFSNGLVISSRILLTLVLAVITLPVTFAPSLASRTVRYATWVSFTAYIVWLVSVTFAHAHGTLAPNPQWTQVGALWHGVAPILFTFTSSWTLPLYAALKASSPRHTASKPSKRYSFQTLTAASTLLGVLLVLPLCFFSAHPNAPVRASASPTPTPSLEFNVSQDSPRHPPHALIATSNALSLVLAVPIQLITAPPLPIPAHVRRATMLPLSKLALFTITVVLALLPRPALAVQSDILIVLAVASTYVLPAVLHIIAHNFRAPLSIVLPAGQGSPPGDELLRRKERMLQRRRLGRRRAWDVVAWMLVLVFGVGGVAVAGGGVAGVW
ncbi:hypothetical protein K488DRAFT_40848 [Vararia minispora EC-137]|uniref:Uncharacterized protein n=1 Tax=Vararia minispora EC-137 TaxID=1314806 RepID=A0ACB8QY26_9AGAM|nr:hypothetical protein K488DRAFT_40848 [Vararia minispora EC-137]